jgi:hypothetical protein
VEGGQGREPGRSEQEQQALAGTYKRERLKLTVLYRCWSLFSAPLTAAFTAAPGLNAATLDAEI